MADPKLKARSNAKPALQALKEQEKSRPAGDSIFVKAENLPVPASVRPETRRIEASFVQPPSETFRREKTQLDPAPATPPTSGTRKISDQTTLILPPSTEAVDPLQPKIPRVSKYKKPERVVPPGLVIALIVAGIALAFSPIGQRAIHSAPDASLVTDQDRELWDQDIHQHLDRTGKKLNRERVQVEYENQLTTQDINSGTHAEKDADMMRGLPLVGEDHARAGSRPKDEMVNLAYPDARTQYSLDEEKNIRDWEGRANKRYQDEFVENAAKAGYAVKIGPDGVAKIIGRVPRKPSGFKVDDRLPEDAGPGRGGLSK